MNYNIFTDGACSGNPGPGAWAFLVLTDGFGDEGKYSTSGAVEAATNQKMELQAVIEALKWITANGVEPFTAMITTDSVYVKDGVTSWLANWKQNGWKTRAKEPVKNREQWEEIDRLVSGLTLEWKWIEGHGEDENNKFVDKLAVKAVKELKRRLTCP